MSRRFVLVDRDGTINEERDYVLMPSQLRLIPRAADALRQLRRLGLGIVIVTNQSPVGRGWLTLEQLGEIHERLLDLLAEGGAGVDGIEFCPHAPDDGCLCRKPGTGMVLRAAAEHGFDPAEAFVVGDHASDLELGRRLGARTILVLTGRGRDAMADGADALADHVAPDLRAAADMIEAEVLAGVDP